MLVVAASVLTGWAYGWGVRQVWRAAGVGRGVRVWQAWCFAVAILALVGALEGPVDQLAHALFAAHMVQHLVLLLVVAPLVVLGAPLAGLGWALPGAARTAGGLVHVVRGLARMPLAFVLHSLALWLWHVPALYDAALANAAIHVLEHASFLFTALLFWWALLGGGRAGYGAGVLYVFAMALQTTVLGALLTFAGAAWYTAHVATTTDFGLTRVEDQQLAGLIMWIPGGLVYLGSGLALFGAWLQEHTTSAASS